MGDQQEIHIGEGSACLHHLGKQFLRRGKNIVVPSKSVNQHLLAARLDQEAFIADVGYVESPLRRFGSDSGS